MRKGEAEAWCDRELKTVCAEFGMVHLTAAMENFSPPERKFRSTAEVREYYMRRPVTVPRERSK